MHRLSYRILFTGILFLALSHSSFSQKGNENNSDTVYNRYYPTFRIYTKALNLLWANTAIGIEYRINKRFGVNLSTTAINRNSALFLRSTGLNSVYTSQANMHGSDLSAGLKYYLNERNYATPETAYKKEQC